MQQGLFTKDNHQIMQVLRAWLLIIILCLSACNQARSSNVLPTVAQADAVATSLLLTEKAPPAGFDVVSFPAIDNNLNALAGWRYEMVFAFNGVYARTPRETATSTEAMVTYNQVGSERRVVATIENDLEGENDPVQYEGVRLGPDVFLLRDGICLPNASNAAQLADLSAGDLLGGIQEAGVLPRIERINGTEVWQYDFKYEDMLLPNLKLAEDGRVLEMKGELWVSPQNKAVIRYYVNLEVENVFLLEQNLPVTGEIIMRYDLYDIGIAPNISVPFGC
jgi:hypothetical protein